MNNRIKALRKTLGLSQREFGRKLGIGDTAVSKIEKGENNPSDQTIKLICREFNVDHLWLTTGEGEMFFKRDYAALDVIDRVLSGESEFARMLFKGFAQFGTDDWKALEDLIRKFLSGYSIEEIKNFLEK